MGFVTRTICSAWLGIYCVGWTTIPGIPTIESWSGVTSDRYVLQRKGDSQHTFSNGAWDATKRIVDSSLIGKKHDIRDYVNGAPSGYKNDLGFTSAVVL